MPTAAVVSAGTPGAPAAPAGKGQQPVMPVVPFIRASGLHRENMIDVTRQMATADQDLGLFDVPAYGYLRSVVLLVTATGGVGTTLSADPDAPFNALKNITLQEPNGATIAQFNNGYDLFLSNKWGGYRGMNDPRMYPSYAVPTATAATFKFLVRIPVELSQRDGLGALPNQDSAATFKVRLTLAGSGVVFSGAGSNVTTQPQVRVQGWVETWDQPPPQTAGATNQTMPPAVNTTQYWNPQQYNINTGQQSPRVTRMGNYIREWLFVFRNAAGVRTDDWPDPFTLMLDSRPKEVINKEAWRQTMVERSGYWANGRDVVNSLDTGVWVYDFAHEFDGTIGHENRDLWLPTLGSSRVELTGVYPNSGTLTVLTNDVSVAGTVFM